MSGEWLEQRERGNIIGIWLIVSLALLVGRPIARLALYPLCLYFLLFSVKPRAGSRKYLALVLNRRPGLADLFRHYFTFAAVALDRFFLLKDRYDLFETLIHGEDELLQTMNLGQGCLLLGAHLGSFEILRARGANQVDVALMMYEDNARMVNSVAKAINPALVGNVIPLGRVDSLFKIQERMHRTSCVGMLGDRTLIEAGQIRVQFLGETASFPPAPFRIALALKRPVVLMLGLYRGGNRYELYFEKLFEPAEVGQGRRAAAIEDAVRLYARRLEHYCRQAPYNWFNFYDFWSGPSQRVAAR